MIAPSYSQGTYIHIPWISSPEHGRFRQEPLIRTSLQDQDVRKLLREARGMFSHVSKGRTLTSFQWCLSMDITCRHVEYVEWPPVMVGYWGWCIMVYHWAHMFGVISIMQLLSLANIDLWNWRCHCASVAKHATYEPYTVHIVHVKTSLMCSWGSLLFISLQVLGP